MKDYVKMKLLVNELESRTLPSTYLWSPSYSVLAGRSTAWSVSGNWQIYSNFNGGFIDQNVVPGFVPGAGDKVVFDGAGTATDNDCVVDIAGGVVVKDVSIVNGYTESIILTNPLTLSDGLLGMTSQGGTIRGSAIGAPHIRGTLNLNDSTVWAYGAGAIEDITVNVNNSLLTGR